MPRSANPGSSPGFKIRRSSRLNNLQEGIKGNSLLGIEAERPRLKRIKVTASADSSILGSSFTACLTEDTSLSKENVCKTSERRRSARITPSELIRREAALLKKEQEYKRKADELDERSLTLMKKEDEASLMLLQMAEREAKAMLEQLEEHFTCSLCYEVMAHPYTLNPGQCGHTFCAICILKWFFSRLHRACGGWHESVDCPICRSLLVITPDRIPRLDITFPFVPNRIAGSVCESLIDKLARSPAGSRLTVKREDVESGLGSGWDIEWGTKKGKSKEEEEMEENSNVAGWREGGSSRTEWLKRDRDGKHEMSYVLKSWTTLQSDDFVVLKQKLGV